VLNHTLLARPDASSSSPPTTLDCRPGMQHPPSKHQPPSSARALTHPVIGGNGVICHSSCKLKIQPKKYYHVKLCGIVDKVKGHHMHGCHQQAAAKQTHDKIWQAQTIQWANSVNWGIVYNNTTGHICHTQTGANGAQHKMLQHPNLIFSRTQSF
jgi:hypothetical protein